MSKPLKIGILETGQPALEHQKDFGCYPDMFRKLLGNDLTFKEFSVLNDVFPSSASECDGWIITGSRHGVYEELPWMLKTEELIRAIIEEKIPLIGVCFGHQIMAKALGGRVEKSTKGWGIGIQNYKIVENMDWMEPALNNVSLSTIHQDQVVTLPETAKIIASSDFCPYGILAYGDCAISIQSHPEFTLDYLEQIIDRPGVPEEILEKAKHSIATTTADSGNLSKWILNFLKQKKK